MAFILAFFLASFSHAADGPPPVLAFAAGDKEVLRLTAADMAKRPSARTVEIDDWIYKARKRYKAVPLKDLLTAAYGGTWGENALGDVFFEAIDGYRSHAKVAVLMNDGAMLAFADADFPDWATMPRPRSGTAGPFYLIWTGPAQGEKSNYPWPYKIASVKMTILEDEFPKALPKGAAPDSAAARGWTTFKSSCISCHSMSGAGGTVGPDLNEPRGITRYQSKPFLKSYIRKASSYRRTKMPDFEELERADLDALMAYFDHMSNLAGTK